MNIYEKLLTIIIAVGMAPTRDVLTVFGESFPPDYFSVDDWEYYNVGFTSIPENPGGGAITGYGYNGKGQGKPSDGKGSASASGDGPVSFSALPLTYLQSTDLVVHGRNVQALRAMEIALQSALIG